MREHRKRGRINYLFAFNLLLRDIMLEVVEVVHRGGMTLGDSIEIL